MRENKQRKNIYVCSIMLTMVSDITVQSTERYNKNTYVYFHIAFVNRT